MELLRCDGNHPDFKHLVTFLDRDLAIRDGAEHDFYHQFNSISDIRYAIVAYVDGKPSGCGAIKPFDAHAAEVKRMYVPDEMRRRGIAQNVLEALEDWAGELGFEKCVLETGKKQPEAIALYRNSGYRAIPNYGQYIGVENSVCFEKVL